MSWEITGGKQDGMEGEKRGRQGKLVRRKTDRDEDGDRRKERQRNLERLKQRHRQQRCLWRLEWS